MSFGSFNGLNIELGKIWYGISKNDLPKISDDDKFIIVKYINELSHGKILFRRIIGCDRDNIFHIAMSIIYTREK